MLGFGTCSVSVPAPGRGAELDPASPHYVLALPEEETWRKHRLGLMQTTQSCNLLEPESLAEALVSRAASFDALYEPRSGDADTETGNTLDLGMGQYGPISPDVIKRRRGGLIEQRDIIKAHEAHKMQSTPQARRKEWE